MVVMAHAVGSPEFYWAIVAEVSLLVWTGLLLVAPRLSGLAATAGASASWGSPPPCWPP
ncbi:MAG: hypothetical protein H0U06_11410 [Solirubrobacterales bacterium]|nr:hypothetical protein [Solirubrobacterales bacterium]